MVTDKIVSMAMLLFCLAGHYDGKEKKVKEQLTIKNLSLDLLYDLVGSLLFALGIDCFVNPANLAPGGMSGVAILLNYLWNLPIGMMTFVLNIPLLILSYMFLGKSLTFKTVKSLVISSIMVDVVVAGLAPVYTGDRMIGAVFGGILMGAGLAVIFLRGSTTGGTDIISFLVRKWYPHVQIGRIMMLVDCIIIGVSIFVFGNMESGLYGLVSLFCCSTVIDSIIYGLDKGSMVMVISDRNSEIAEQIMKELERGVTLLKGQGAYTGQDRDVLMCAVRKQQFGRIRAIIYQTDPSAFVIVSETSEVLGEGFKQVSGS